MADHVAFYRSFEVCKDKRLPKGEFYLVATDKEPLPQQLQGTYSTVEAANKAIDDYIENYFETLPKTIRGHRWEWTFHQPFAWVSGNILLTLTDKGVSGIWVHTSEGFKRAPREQAREVFNFLQVSHNKGVTIALFDEIDRSQYFQ